MFLHLIINLNIYNSNMEQAINQFTKGLQCDTHPMVQGNDTLTDCLNGTLITMNGDEVILQNDMGNRRVDNAFLPAGFEPVGIKEYGGIIYIAAYNPITDQSQIGSFPSPQRKYISNVGIDQSINLATCNSDDNWLKIAPILLPLSKENIHVGDKFAFCFSNDDIISKLSNYNNTNDDGKVLSPKNKLYTLSIGVLDEYGKFYDITSRLCRYKGSSGTPISYTNNESDLYKFNDGYFIASSSASLTNNDTQFSTIADQNLEESRFMKTYGNTYSEKFIGPLYLKIEQNYIQDFTYNLEAKKIQKKESQNSSTLVTAIRIKLTGKFTYNCPDGCTLSSDVDDTYASYYTGKTIFNFFDFNISNPKDKEGNSVTYNKSIPSVNPEVTYDKTTNLYTAVVTKQFDITSNNDSLASFNYDIKVRANSECTSYIRELSSLDNYFDVSLINSNTLKLNGWRFTNDIIDRKTTIRYSLESYPAKNVKFVNLTMIFKDVANSSFKYIKSGIDISNGINEVTIQWDDLDINGNHLEARKLYNVSLKYNKINALTGELLPSSSSYPIMEREGGTGHYYYSDLIKYDGNIITDIINNRKGDIFIPAPFQSRSVGQIQEGTNTFDVDEYYSDVNNSSNLWLLTTKLLNNYYNIINNFCETYMENNVLKLSNKEIRDALDIKCNIQFYNIYSSEKSNSTKIIGNPVELSNKTIDYKCEHKVELNITGNYKIEYNEELYPDFISINIQDTYIQFEFIKSIIEQMCKNDYNISIFSNTSKFNSSSDKIFVKFNNNNTFMVVSNVGTDSNPIYNDYITIFYYDYLSGEPDMQRTINIEKAIIPLEEIIYDILPQSGYKEYATSSIIKNSNNAYKPVLVLSKNIDGDSDKYEIGGINTNQQNYDIENIINSNNSPYNKLFTFLPPTPGIPLHNNVDHVVKFVDYNNSINCFDANNYNKSRVFVKCKKNNRYQWILVKINNQYYDTINTAPEIIQSYTPQNLIDKLCKYQQNKVYVYTKLTNSRNINIYYCNNLNNTGEYNIDTSLKCKTDYQQVHLLMTKSINSQSENAFTRELKYNLQNVNNIYTNENNIITTNSEKLEETISAIISGNINALGRMIVLDNNLLLITNESVDYNSNFFKFYYLSNNEPKVLTSKLLLNEACLVDIQETSIESNSVYDEHTFNNNEDSISITISYSNCISLDNNNSIYSE